MHRNSNKSAHSTDTWHREDDDPNAIPDGGACHTSHVLESVNASLLEVRDGTVSSDIAPGRAMTALTAVNASRNCERQLQPQACLQQAAAHSASPSVQRTRLHRLLTLFALNLVAPHQLTPSLLSSKLPPLLACAESPADNPHCDKHRGCRTAPPLTECHLAARNSSLASRPSIFTRRICDVPTFVGSWLCRQWRLLLRCDSDFSGSCSLALLYSLSC